jgi:hypothetical protein
MWVSFRVAGVFLRRRSRLDSQVTNGIASHARRNKLPPAGGIGAMPLFRAPWMILEA